MSSNFSFSFSSSVLVYIEVLFFSSTILDEDGWGSEGVGLSFFLSRQSIVLMSILISGMSSILVVSSSG